MSSTHSTRMPYPSDVSDDEWAFVAPYVVLAALSGLHFVVFACLMLAQLLHFISSP